jgi:hypothetical protein
MNTRQQNTTQSYTYNNVQISPSNLLHYTRQQYLNNINDNNVSSIVAYTNINTDAITSTIYNQLIQIRDQRYVPYQPYIYPVIPSSVVQLKMNSANAGLPESFFQYSNCKGNQTYTK